MQQGFYNLELLAIPDCPNGTQTCVNNPTDLYAGAINLYKCSIQNTNNPVCSAPGFLNLTHAYGCDPIGAPAHVHPDQHALAEITPTSGGDSGNALLYFANDGGIYRSLSGFLGLNSGDCSGTNEFEDLNQNLGSMTQFVSFSQHPSDPNTLLGGTQDNGSPATAQATTNLAWVNVLGGDGGYNAIDPGSTSDWYASNPDIPPGGLGIQHCASGVNCDNGLFNFVVTSSSVGDDDGGFYFPYILDPASTTAMLVGTCRVWRGSRAGGIFTALSPNFETLGSGTCSGAEINQVRALAVGGRASSNGSNVIYATTSGVGPTVGPTTPQGGRVWVTTNASAGPPAFADMTDNGPQGDINPNQFPVSGVATDPSDGTGNTAYVTVMGFTGGLGHVWKTTNAGAAWIDFTGNLPDSPVNAAIVDSALSRVYVATDVGVFASLTAAPRWTELGPDPSAESSGFLPNVAVTALGLFSSGGQRLLRVSTYGRGIWEFNLASQPDFQISVANSPQTISTGATATFTGSVSALDGYSGTVTLSCVAGETSAPSNCSSPQSPLTPALSTPFTVTASGVTGDYYFNLQGVGSGSQPTTHLAAAELHILSAAPDFALRENGSFPTVNAGSSTTSGPISVTATNGFTGTVSLTCSLVSGNGSCSANPSSVTSIPTTASITVNATSLSAGTYQLIVHGTSGASNHTLLISFNVADFQVVGPQSLLLGPGTGGTTNLTVQGTTFYAGTINSTCSATLPATTCAVTPSPTTLSTGTSASLVATVSLPSNAATGTYNVNVNVADTSGIPAHSVAFPLTVQDFTMSASPASQAVNPGASAAYSLTIQPVAPSFNSAISFSCPSGLPPGTQCTFQPSTPVTPGASPVVATVTIATGASTTPGTYTVTLKGISGSLARSTNAVLTVNTPATSSRDFQLAVTQSFPAGIAAGAQVQAGVSVTSNYGGSVTATCVAISVSGQCTVTPSPLAISANAPSNLLVAVNVPNSVSPATYNINLTVTDSSKQLIHTLQLPLNVIPDFTVNSGTPTQTMTAGQTTSGPYQLTVAPNPTGSAFAGVVTLSCPSGLPAGAQCLFAPSTPLTLGNSSAAVVMTITTSSSKVARLSPSGPSLLYAIWLLLPGLIVVYGAAPVRSAKSKARLLCFAAMLLVIWSTLSCGGVSNGGGSSTTGNQPTTHQITITGTSPGTTVDAGQSTIVTLVID